MKEVKNSMKLSIVIPSYKDILLHKTIDSLLENSELGDELEIIVVLDGYWTVAPIKDDKRVKIVHLGRNRGMRGAINAGVAISRGEFIMRTDEHCKYSKGFDKILVESCQPNWIMTLKRYFLDPIKWEYMDIPPIECEKLVIQDCGNGVRKFSGRKWDSRAERLKNEPIIEGEAMQGSMWCMSRDWWNNVIGELSTEGYGQLIQDSVEMCMKTWKAGGKLMWNKSVHYGHKHRSFPRLHNNGTEENPANCDAGYKYALDLWEDYYKNELLPKWNQTL